jgi:hypothetical protein
MIGPKRRDRHYSYDESVDEPAKLIEDEPVDIEEEVPAEGNRPVERSEENDKPDLGAYEE